MKRKALYCMLIALTLSSLTACGKQKVVEPVDALVDDSSKDEDDTHNDIEPIRQDGTNLEKSIEITDRIYQDTQQNTMFSPTSLNFALGLLLEGADEGSTSESSLTSYLGSNFSAKASEYMTETIKNFNSNSEYNGYKTIFDIANSIWFTDKLHIAKEYENNVISKYNAEIDTINVGDKDNSAKKVNEWCDKKTHGLISKVINPESINNDTSAILVNSVYLETPWDEEWYTETNETNNFINLDGTQSDAIIIHKSTDKYYENSKATAFGVRYMNNMEFIGIMPNQTGDFELADLDIPSLISKQEKGNIVVEASMPELNFETEANLGDILRESELKGIFEDSLDFVGMSEEHEPVKVSNVIQKTKLELDKYGTKAAAVTAISMETCGIAPMPEEQRTVEVHLDRPFAFIIYDRENNEVIFIGKVTNL